MKRGVNRMEVTDVRLRKVVTEGRMRAIASITLDNEFVAMPSKRTTEGEFRDIAHPINVGTRTKIQEAILYAYHLSGELEEKIEEPSI